MTDEQEPAQPTVVRLELEYSDGKTLRAVGPDAQSIWGHFEDMLMMNQIRGGRYAGPMMEKIGEPLQHKGYSGALRIDFDAGVLRGKVVNTRDTITFQGKTVEEATQAFRDSVDSYLEFCHEQKEDER